MRCVAYSASSAFLMPCVFPSELCAGEQNAVRAKNFGSFFLAFTAAVASTAAAVLRADWMLNQNESVSRWWAKMKRNPVSGPAKVCFLPVRSRHANGCRTAACSQFATLF